MIKIVVIGILLAVAGVMLYVRFTPTDAAMWHVDPRAISKPAKPNNWLIRPVGGDARPPHYRAEVADLVAAIEAAAAGMGDMRLIAGSAQSGHLTYQSRTKWMGFPDFTTFRVYSTDEGVSFAAFSQARFGHSDLGYNRARLEAMLALIEAEMAARAPT
jgi:uncharacterized protein (DUF1499 family)